MAVEFRNIQLILPSTVLVEAPHSDIIILRTSMPKSSDFVIPQKNNQMINDQISPINIPVLFTGYLTS